MLRSIALHTLVIAISLSPLSLRAQSHLDIEPVYQQTPVWCWAAVGEMVFRYYGVPSINRAGNFQCGIISLLHPVCDHNCFNCIVPAGDLATMNRMLTQYSHFASQYTGRSTYIRTTARHTRLSLHDVRAELDAGRPIVAGISPSGYNTMGVSEHVALIVGYDGNHLIVNDPFPFGSDAFTGNPYFNAGGVALKQGQYKIPYAGFVSRLHWRETIYGVACEGLDCVSHSTSVLDEPVQYGRSCLTQAGRCGPFPNQPAMPIGSPCWCGGPYAPVNGRVVQP